MTETRTCSLVSNIHILGSLKRIQQRQHARIGGGISKTRKRALNQRREDTAVETGDASVRV